MSWLPKSFEGRVDFADFGFAARGGAGRPLWGPMDPVQWTRSMQRARELCILKDGF